MSDPNPGGSSYWHRVNEEQEARNRAITNRFPLYLLSSLLGISGFHAVLGLLAAVTGRHRLLADTPRGGLVWLLVMVVDLMTMRLWRRRHRADVATESVP